MKRRYILYRRKRGGMFYIEDTETRKQESTGTKNRAEATSLLNARNESVRQPQLNLQIAKAYLAGTDSGVATRTWQQALDAIVETKSGSTQDRWRRAAKEIALDPFAIASFLKRKPSICSPASRRARSARMSICGNSTTSAFR
jgi:hypothetical protein